MYRAMRCQYFVPSGLLTAALLAAAFLATGVLVPTSASAGGTGPLRKFWKKQPPVPPAAVSGYRPATARVVVVDPVPYGSLSGHYGTGPTWRQENLAAPMYPWGWFGARSQSHNSVHTRYYEDAVDWNFSR